MRMRFSIQATALMPVFDPEVTLLFIQDSQANKYSIQESEITSIDKNKLLTSRKR